MILGHCLCDYQGVAIQVYNLLQRVLEGNCPEFPIALEIMGTLEDLRFADNLVNTAPQ
jgi:hypothetical protein